MIILLSLPEDEDMLLLRAVLLLLHHDQSQLLLLKIQFHNSWPEEKSDLLTAFVNQDSCEPRLVRSVPSGGARSPVGVSPSEYCEPSLPSTVWVSTPYISSSLARHRYSVSASHGLLPLNIIRS